MRYILNTNGKDVKKEFLEEMISRFLGEKITINRVDPECKMETPTEPIDDTCDSCNRIFLAGTIDNGDSEDWQNEFYNWFVDKVLPSSRYDDWVFYNPRRKEWIKNAPKDELEYQINWEQDRLEKCDVVIMNILPNSKSPISLLELGQFHKKMWVICPKEFYRYDNVRIVCERNEVDLFDSMDEFKEYFASRFSK